MSEATAQPAFEKAETTVNTPDFRRPELARFQLARDRGRDLMIGTDAIHAASIKYLPKWANEDDDLYRIRSTLTEVYGAFPRCVSAARGLVGAKPPSIPQTAPQQIQDQWADLDGQGTHGEVLTMRIFEEGLVDGVIAILVDAPSFDASGKTLADAQQAGLRPYWITITVDQIVNWRETKVGGKTMLSMVTIHEEVEEDVGDYGVECVEQYRTIRRLVGPAADRNGVYTVTIAWEIKRKKVEGNKEVWFVYNNGTYVGPTRIPLAVGYLGRKRGTMLAEPPLAQLAELNIGHYRVSSDRRYMMSIVHAPTFVLEGWTEPVRSADNPMMQNSGITGEINLGPNSIVKTPPNCKALWVQADPSGLDSSKQEKDDIVAQMASLSIAFLSQERKSQETATAHRINSTAQNATLSTAARGLEDLIDEALEIHQEYLSGSGEQVAEPVTSTVNTTYDEDALDAPTITALNGMAKDGNLTRKSLLLILQRGNIIPDEIDIDDESDELDQKERENNQAAADAAARTHLALARTAVGSDPSNIDPATGDPANPAPRRRGTKKGTKGTKPPARTARKKTAAV